MGLEWFGSSLPPCCPEIKGPYPRVKSQRRQRPSLCKRGSSRNPCALGAARVGFLSTTEGTLGLGLVRTRGSLKCPEVGSAAPAERISRERPPERDLCLHGLIQGGCASPALSLSTDSTESYAVLKVGKDLQDHQVQPLSEHHLVQQDFELLLCSGQGWGTALALIPSRCRWTSSQIPDGIPCPPWGTGHQPHSFWALCFHPA